MTPDEKAKLDALEKNLMVMAQTLQVQANEAKKQYDSLTIEVYRIEGGLRLIQTIKAEAVPPPPPEKK